MPSTLNPNPRSADFESAPATAGPISNRQDARLCHRTETPPTTGKARTLQILRDAGFNVPPFITSPTNPPDAIKQLGFPLAVRSSASVEDGSSTSFAGQFNSYLNLQSAAEVQDAIAQCHASVRQPSLIAYCQKNNVDPATVEMHTIVQRMVQPELAGVIFTINPTTGADEIVVEACPGLADNLLAGKEQPLPPNHPLLLHYRPELERVAHDIHRHFGEPQDIEFAIENGELFILQARPVTRVNFTPDSGEWTNADFRDGGVSSRVCTPLMWSLYDYIWEDTLKGFLRDIHLFQEDFQAGRMFFGRPYWNLGAVKQCLSELPGYNERKFDEDLGIHSHPDHPGMETPVTLKRILKALPTVLAVGLTWKKQARFDERFLGGEFEKLFQPYTHIPASEEPPLEQLLTHAYRITESNYFRTIYCASLAKMAFKDSFPDVDCNALVSGLPRLQHLEPTHALRQLAARGDKDIRPLLQQFGHHSRRELDISCPRWDEDHEWVRALLANATMAPQPSNPPQEFESIRDATLARLPWHQRRSFLRKLNRLRHFLWLREEMRDLSSRVYQLIRKYVLAIAQERTLGDDIFFMTFQEILRDDRSNIERNRDLYHRYRNFDAPNEVGSKFRSTEPTGSGDLTGICASGGTVTGIARIARTIEEALQVEEGAILVCPYTDPGWTPVLGKVSGVVTENGGQLSHAAVICREYGIPAVLNVPHATQRIPDGSIISLVAESVRIQNMNLNTSVAESACPPQLQRRWVRIRNNAKPNLNTVTKHRK